MNINKKQKIIFIIVILLAIIGIIYYVYYKKDQDLSFEIIEKELIPYDGNVNNEIENNIEVDDLGIIIYITGAVNNGGVYTLNEDSRIADAIEKAGGLREDANIAKINLAYKLQDGMKIYIPSVNDKEDDVNKVDDTESFIIKESSSSNAQSNSQKVNINKATQTELETLPGIGPSIALKIINYRKENGKFKSIEDLKNVSGIGDNKFNQIKNYICV